MNEPAKLFLVRPDEQPSPDANFRSVVESISALLFASNMGNASAVVNSVRYCMTPRDHYIEVCYWFDPTNLLHHVVFWGDAPTPDDLHVPNYAPHEHAYFWFPYVIYNFVSGRDIHPSPEFLKELIEFDPITRLPIIRDYDLVIPPDILSSVSDESFNSKGKSSAGEDWRATLILVEFANRIPAVRIPKAAALLDVEEETIRNRITWRELEGIQRQGTLWVTKRSIAAYVKEHYYPSVYFNVWDEVEAKMKRSFEKTP
jgi:hypothetical protein